MDIISEIDTLKEKINNEIESLRYYKELSYICNALENEVNSYEYDINDNYSLKKYKAFLEFFLENKIGYVNSLIVNKNNNSIFDNGSDLDYQKLNELKKEISELLTYIENNFPIIGREVAEEYEKIKMHYEKEFSDASNRYKKTFDKEIGVNKEINLSIYGDTSSVLKSYINNLSAFKKVRVDNIKIFVDNDIEVKELFKRAYETLKEPRAIEAVRKLESNYVNEINKCVESMSANTNILLIQKNMIQNGLQLDKIIDIEKEKNDIYNKISNITFNYDNIDELLKIEDYVIKNNIFHEEFYKVLFALVEKEKYLYLKYKHEPIIYKRINERSRVALEKIFLDQIKDLDDSEKEELIINLKKNGYFKVLDMNYQEFFDNKDFKLETTYDTEPLIYNWKLERKRIEKGIIEPHYDVINKETNKRVDRFFNLPKYNDELTRIGDIYIFSRSKIMFGYETTPIIHYNYYDQDGKKIKPFKDNSVITDSLLDYYLVEKKDDSFHKNKRIVDSNFNTIMEYEGKNIHKEILVDYKNNLILILDTIKKTFSLYNKDFKLLKELSASEIMNFNINDIVISFDNINMFNEGIFSVLVKKQKENYICYYDIINMRKVDMFKIDLISSLYGYSEGLYPYCEYYQNRYLLGYKNIDGDIVLEPKYLRANPFINGCALVIRDLSISYAFINYRGECVGSGEILGYDDKSITPNFFKYRYQAFYYGKDKRVIVKTKNTYIIDYEDNIIDLDLNNKNKVKKKMA